MNYSYCLFMWMLGHHGKQQALSQLSYLHSFWTVSPLIYLLCVCIFLLSKHCVKAAFNSVLQFQSVITVYMTVLQKEQE